MALGMEVGLGPGHIVLDGDPAPLPKKGTEPPFSAHFYCDQTAGCMKMPLGMEVGLGPGDMGTQLPSPKEAQRLQFSANVRCGPMAGWINMPLGMEVGLAQAILC